jgi:hypothetical protein
MTDATGHMDRPGAGPSSVNLVNPITGMLANLYYHPNPITGKHEIVKPNPPGMADEILAEFDTYQQAKDWFLNYCQQTT